MIQGSQSALKRVYPGLPLAPAAEQQFPDFPVLFTN
jgi:hypothetical protein